MADPLLQEKTLELLGEIQRQQIANTQRLDLLAEDVSKNGSARAGESEDAEQSEARLNAVERAVKWASPWRNLVVLVVFFVLGAFGAYTTMRDYARRAVIDTVKAAHNGEDPEIEPSVRTVDGIQSDLGSVKSGVDCLVAEKHREKLIREVEIELELHRQQYDQQVQEWSANKAAGRFIKKPTKSDGYLALEARLQKVVTQKEQLCSEDDEP